MRIWLQLQAHEWLPKFSELSVLPSLLLTKSSAPSVAAADNLLAAARRQRLLQSEREQ
jgi:hypothetical protein